MCVAGKKTMAPYICLIICSLKSVIVYNSYCIFNFTPPEAQNLKFIWQILLFFCIITYFVVSLRNFFACISFFIFVDCVVLRC